MRGLLRVVAAATTVAVLAAACAGRSDDDSSGSDPGITDDTIKIGSSMPYSGPLATFGLYGDGARAYFNYVNANGGIDGRQIEFTVYDDGATPARTVENVNRLVQQDEVFALSFIFGTASNLAVRDSLNEQEIPQVFAETGFPGFGSTENIEKYPWTIGWLPPYTLEAAVDAEYLKEHNPDAKVAVLYQNDDLGKSLLQGFEAAIEGSDISIVERQSYNISDPTVSSQVTVLANAGADVFLNFSQGKFTPQSISTMVQLGWQPTTFIPSFDTAISILEPAGLDNAEGFLAPVYLKDLDDPRWQDDPAVQEYLEIVEEHGEGVDGTHHNVIFGYTEAQLLVEALKGMEEPTRESFMESVRNLEDVRLPLLLPEISIATGPEDGYPIETVGMRQFDGSSWVSTGDIFNFEGNADSLLR